MIARLSALAFLGPKFCRNQDWIDVSVNYTLDVFNAARILNLWLPILRPIVVWFLPETRKLRTHLQKARSIIEPEMAARARKRKQYVKRGGNSDVGEEKNYDALEWFRESSEAAGKPLDITLSQICLSIAAIHITSQLLINVMYDLAAYPDHIPALREELSRVLEEDGGWKSTFCPSFPVSPISLIHLSSSTPPPFPQPNPHQKGKHHPSFSPVLVLWLRRW